MHKGERGQLVVPPNLISSWEYPVMEKECEVLPKIDFQLDNYKSHTLNHTL